MMKASSILSKRQKFDNSLIHDGKKKFQKFCFCQATLPKEVGFGFRMQHEKF